MADDKEAKAPAKAAAKPATKQILRDVVYHDRTFKAGDEDDLERRLTAADVKRLTADDPPTLAGEWSPGGEGAGPMLRSPLGDAPSGTRAVQLRAKAAGVPGVERGHPAQAEAERLREEVKRLKAAPHPAESEAERLKAENAKLRADLDKAQKAGK